jgi:hypothetical protein
MWGRTGGHPWGPPPPAGPPRRAPPWWFDFGVPKLVRKRGVQNGGFLGVQIGWFWVVGKGGFPGGFNRYINWFEIWQKRFFLTDFLPEKKRKKMVPPFWTLFCNILYPPFLGVPGGVRRRGVQKGGVRRGSFLGSPRVTPRRPQSAHPDFSWFWKVHPRVFIDRLFVFGQ